MMEPSATCWLTLILEMNQLQKIQWKNVAQDEVYARPVTV